LWNACGSLLGNNHWRIQVMQIVISNDMIEALFPEPEDCFIHFYRAAAFPVDCKPTQLIAWAKCKADGHWLGLTHLDQFSDETPDVAFVYSSGLLICKQWSVCWPSNLRLAFPFVLRMI
jgi:hypothetical protein